MASLYLSINKIFADKSEPWFLPRYPFPCFRDLPSSSNRKTCKGTWERCSRGARSKCVTSNTQASEFCHLIQALKSFPLSTLSLLIRGLRTEPFLWIIMAKWCSQGPLGQHLAMKRSKP
ncbi:unnamed protein product [Brassica rapa subsp. narinosa]